MYGTGPILLADKRRDDMNVGNHTKPRAIFSSTMAVLLAQITHISSQTIMCLLLILDILSVLIKNHLVFLVGIDVNCIKFLAFVSHLCPVTWCWLVCADALKFCHMRAMAFRITNNLTVSPTVCSCYQRRKYQSTVLPAHCEGNPLQYTLHKGQVMQKGFYVMTSPWRFFIVICQH